MKPAALLALTFLIALGSCKRNSTPTTLFHNPYPVYTVEFQFTANGVNFDWIGRYNSYPGTDTLDIYVASLDPNLAFTSSFGGVPAASMNAASPTDSTMYLRFELYAPVTSSSPYLQRGIYAWAVGNPTDTLGLIGFATLFHGYWNTLISDTVTVDSVNATFGVASGTFSATYADTTGALLHLSGGTFRNVPNQLGINNKIP